MKVWAVFVHCTAAGYQSRWIDSLWAEEAHACSREAQLDRMLSGLAFNVPAHRTSRVQMEVEDAEIASPPRLDEEKPDKPCAEAPPFETSAERIVFPESFDSHE